MSRRGRASEVAGKPEASGDRASRAVIELRSPNGGSKIVRRAPKVAELVALEIVRDIADRGLAQGDRLPQEAEMLALYGVGRASLREALRLLEAQGLIAIRPGAAGGASVGRPSPVNLARTAIPFLHLAGATYGDALEAWSQTEPLLARAAALSPDRAKVTEAMHPFIAEHAVGRDWGVSEGIGFHDTIALLAGNPVLDLMLQAVAHIVSDHLLNTTPKHGLYPWIVADHAKLAAAIVDGDGEMAATLMAEHTRHVIAHFASHAPHRIGERIQWF